MDLYLVYFDTWYRFNDKLNHNLKIVNICISWLFNTILVNVADNYE